MAPAQDENDIGRVTYCWKASPDGVSPAIKTQRKIKRLLPRKVLWLSTNPLSCMRQWLYCTEGMNREGNWQFILTTCYLINWTQRLDSLPGLEARNKKVSLKCYLTRWHYFFGSTKKPKTTNCCFPLPELVICFEFASSQICQMIKTKIRTVFVKILPVPIAVERE